MGRKTAIQKRKKTNGTLPAAGNREAMTTTVPNAEAIAHNRRSAQCAELLPGRRPRHLTMLLPPAIRSGACQRLRSLQNAGGRECALAFR